MMGLPAIASLFTWGACVVSLLGGLHGATANQISNLPPRAYTEETLADGISYVRVYDLANSQAKLAERLTQATIIIDLRYLSAHEAAIQFGELFMPMAHLLNGAVPEATLSTPQEKKLIIQRATPPIVLCNQQTTGFIEVVLAELQENGKIFTVGTATAGNSGHDTSHDSEETVGRLGDEVRPSDGSSLIVSGFKPRIELEIDPETDYRGYFLYESGSSLGRLTGKDSTHEMLDPHSKEEEEDASSVIKDRTLQKALDVVAALQILEQLPK